MAELKFGCETCKHNYLGPGYEPCASCGDTFHNWESGINEFFEESGPETYTYFVSYFYISDRGQPGVGNCKVERTRKLRTMNDVTEIANDIQIKYNFDGITVLNWKELEG